jgi:hypothetical protein
MALNPVNHSAAPESPLGEPWSEEWLADCEGPAPGWRGGRQRRRVSNRATPGLFQANCALRAKASTRSRSRVPSTSYARCRRDLVNLLRDVENHLVSRAFGDSPGDGRRNQLVGRRIRPPGSTRRSPLSH